ncbi:hypothetical protein TWF696_000428 [Orbilia brochopaga]|uniref:Uncharacterized protein n=1 Tax=Orbilia brochopaga TaxID=3140254 RepID=A0AAV9VB88_9PEZI
MPDRQAAANRTAERTAKHTAKRTAKRTTKRIEKRTAKRSAPEAPLRVRIRTPPPPITVEQRTERHIEGLKHMVRDIPAPTHEIHLPVEYKKSVEVALAAWEAKKVEWGDEKGYLWSPEGLIAEGSIEEIQHMHILKVKAGDRTCHPDFVSYQLQLQSSIHRLVRESN